MVFTELYNQNTLKNAQQNRRRRNTVFVCLSVVFVAYCAAFVALGTTRLADCVVCWLATSVVSVAYFWYVFLFVKLPPDYVCLLHFVSNLSSANKTYFCGAFDGLAEQIERDGITFCVAMFGDKRLLMPCGCIPFVQGRSYQLQLTGNVVIAYKLNEEPEND